MSLLIYLASDCPLQERQSPHNRSMSIHEALSLGVEIPDILDIDKLDKDNPHMLLWSDSYSQNAETGGLQDNLFDDDFSILPMEKWEDILSEKKYCASLEWPTYTKGRAQMLISYIKEHLKHSPQIELWHILMGRSYPPPKIKKTMVHIKDLDETTIQNLYEGTAEDAEQIASQVRLPRDWAYEEDEMERSIQYCLLISR